MKQIFKYLRLVTLGFFQSFFCKCICSEREIISKRLLAIKLYDFNSLIILNNTKKLVTF